ncbi:hypothetical protein N0V93_004175 [Gnomoniopsis smithogilvyi]|uniref:Intradiol ring-cleavage dioxygenases domain-containing protein n=1 Tax=Gnomoniopsis smithogilvyi TaxID=1191159 RepID=A0A9W8YR07_9PEZI|nr:hypothetical protein N0V93_004175 [Gnomoniopsis smithogilvyi]
MRFSNFVAAGLMAVSSTMAHSDILSRSEISRRGAMSKRCEASAANFNKKRQAKQMAKRAWGTGNSTVQLTTEAPFFDTIQNDTCVLTPEATEGPYVWPRSQTLRQDMTEDQPGVPLWLDIGVLDMATCEPLPQAMVNFWHCNATGSYSSFTGISPDTPFPTLLSELNITDFEIGVTDLHTDDTTFLRGMWPTDANGMMEMKTIFPGFYTARAIHIHIQVYTEWTLHPNGTLDSGNLVNTGQVYFAEDLEEQIMALEPYASHTTINRTTNAEDTVIADDSENGYNPIMEVVAADGENVENGMIGFITIGVDTTALYGNE